VRRGDSSIGVAPGESSLTLEDLDLTVLGGADGSSDDSDDAVSVNDFAATPVHGSAGGKGDGVTVPAFFEERIRSRPSSPANSEPPPFDKLAVAPWVSYMLYLWIETTRDEMMFGTFGSFGAAVDDDEDDGGVVDLGPHAPMLGAAKQALEPRARGSSNSFDESKVPEGGSVRVARTASLSTSQSSGSGSSGSERRALRRELSVPKVVYNLDYDDGDGETYREGRLFNTSREAEKARQRTGSNLGTGSAGKAGSERKRRSKKLEEKASDEPDTAEDSPRTEHRPQRSLSNSVRAVMFANRLGSLSRRHSSSVDDDAAVQEDKRRQGILEKWRDMVLNWATILDARTGNFVLLRAHIHRCEEKGLAHVLDEDNLLRAAIRHKHLDCVRYLLDERKLNVNKLNTFGIAPIHFSMLKDASAEQKLDDGVLLKYLLRKGADPTGTSLAGHTLLFNVARNGTSQAVELFEMLLRTKHTTSGGDVRQLSLGTRDNFGATCLHHAVLFGNRELVEYLLRVAADKVDALFTRANWCKEIDTFSTYNMSKDEHITARNSWEPRGLSKFAEHLSPLGVAILHNQGDLARLLMSVNCGAGLQCKRRRTIFYDDNQDLRLLARVWPSLIPDLIKQFSLESGEEAHSNLGYKGTRYILHPWFGHYTTPVYHTPLATMLDFKGSDWNCLYSMRIIQIIIALKWQLFGARYYYTALARFLVLLVSYIMGFVFKKLYLRDETISFVFRWIAWVAAVGLFLHEECREMYVSRWEYFTSAFNWMSLFGYTCVMVMVPAATAMGDPFDDEAEQPYMRTLRAVAGVAITLRVLEFLAIHKTTGRLVAILNRMLHDTARWSGVFALLVIAFSFAFFALLQGEENFESLPAAVFTSFRFTIGEADPPFSDDGYLNGVASVFYMVFTILVHLLYLNVLIAMLSTSYEAVQEDVAASAAYSRASALIQWEATMGQKKRQKMYLRVCPPRGKRVHFHLPPLANGDHTVDLFCEHEIATLFEPDTSFLNLASGNIYFDKRRKERAVLNRMESMERKVMAALDEMRELKRESGGGGGGKEKVLSNE